WNCYDRLISHEMKSGPGSVPYYDRDKFKPELAEDMNVGDMSVTFKLKKNAKFHDGAPVTARDVKWSLDRAVSVGGFPTFQMSAGSLTKPEQFVGVDDARHDHCEIGHGEPILAREIDAEGVIVNDDELLRLGQRAGAHLEGREATHRHGAVERPFHVLGGDRCAVLEGRVLFEFERRRHRSDGEVVGQFAFELV